MNPVRDKAKPRVKTKARVVVVDDHPIVRQGLVQMINHESDLEVCGEAETIAECSRPLPPASPTRPSSTCI